MLADLALTRRIAIDGDHVYADRYARTGDVDLDGFAERIATEPRNRKVKWWVQKTRSAKLRRRLLQRAVERGVLRHEEDRVLLVFPLNRYFPVRPDQREELRARLHSVLVGERAPDPRSVALLALVGAVRSDRRLFPGLPGGERRRRMKEIVADDRIGQAVHKVIQSVEAATAAAAAGAGAGSDGGS